LSTSARRSRLSTRLSTVSLTFVPARCSRSCGRATAAEYSKGTRPTTAMSAMVTRPSARNAYQALRRLDKWCPQPPRRLDDGGQAQPDDVGVAALDARDQGGAAALYRVAAGLVDALAGGHVPRDLPVAQAPEADPRAHDDVLAAARQAQGVARVDVVDRAGEAPQVSGVVSGGGGLVDDLAVDDDRRVCRQDQVARATRAHDLGLGRRQAGDELRRVLAGPHGLVDVGRLHLELQPQAREELATSWRCAGQHESPHADQSTQAGEAVRLPAGM